MIFLMWDGDVCTEDLRWKVTNFEYGLHFTSAGNNTMAGASLLAKFWRNVEMACSRVRVTKEVLNGCFTNSKIFINQRLVYNSIISCLSLKFL